ncbi:carbohydrate ABC transporter permease [Paenibacillus sp. S-38]|uniref:carbohydrate ABC transporter permease n=1 Tax=Paenibacillus sp. S-38 TaxID=3416710 RepID=UPI003CF01685
MEANMQMRTPPKSKSASAGLLRTDRSGASPLAGLLLHAVLIAGALLMTGPFVWMILSSLKQFHQIFLIPPQWIPDPWEWGNYKRSWEALPFGRAYFNSAYIAVLSVIGKLFTCSMAAYAFAKIRFPLREPIFVLFLATMMVPGQVTIIPLYLMMKSIGWIDTHLAILVPEILFSAFGVFMLRQFMKSIPDELAEAAVVDGASRWTIYWRVILPLVRPALAALGIFTFLGLWNNFFGPLIFLNTPEKFTVPLLLNMFRGMYITDWTLMMAGSSIAVVPVLIVYLFGQRYIIEGVTLTGIKG